MKGSTMLLPTYNRPHFRSNNIFTTQRLALIVTAFLLILSLCYRHAIRTTWSASAELLKWVPIEKASQGSKEAILIPLDPSKELISIMEKYSPGALEPIRAVDKAEANRWPPEAPPREPDLMDILKISPEQILEMQKAHREFVSAIEHRLPNFVDIPLQRRQQRPTRGIVTVGGHGYFPPLLVSLRLLRRTGTTLPLEVFLPKEEYEAQLCEQVLPMFNAVCRTFPDLDGKISHYQYKVFAILFSSFIEVLWLDADNFPLKDAAPLFDSAPFQDTGLVTWPDLWQTSISPAYYLISSQAPTPVAARASTESGQLLVCKERHWKTLMLAAYYNYYGPDYYYPLLCQGGAGCGDKETFLPAAEAFGLPFYNVKAQPGQLGHYKVNARPERGIYTFALAQGDLLSDYAATLDLEEAKSRFALRAKSVPGNTEATHAETSEQDAIHITYDDVPPFFLHMSVPKWDAYHVFDHVGSYDLTLDQRKRQAAAFRDPPETSAKIKGVERMVWEETRWVACHLEGIIGYWEGKRGDICHKMEKFFNNTLDTEKGAELGLAADLVPASYMP